MRITRSSTLTDVAFVVCTALHYEGITAVLTGGSAATVYAPRAYQSFDLDFIIQFQKSNSNASATLKSIGYSVEDAHYVHKENPLILEFPVGPLAVGGELIKKWDTKQNNDLILNIITPTDCCRDRLAGFLFWNDRGSLQQAVAVASAQEKNVNLRIIQKWCTSEGHIDKYKEFEQACRQKKQNTAPES